MDHDRASISECLSAFQEGDEEAIARLWGLCFDELVRVARNKLRNLPSRAHDDEDLAASAFHSLYRGAQAGRFQKLDDTNDLWQVLLMITTQKAINQYNAHMTQKRSGGNVRGESVFEAPDGSNRGIADFAVDDFTEQLSIESEEMLQSLEDDLLREIALLKLAGYTNREVAERVDRAKSTVDLKITLIKKRWSDI